MVFNVEQNKVVWRSEDFFGPVGLLDVVVGTCFPNYLEQSNNFVCVTNKLFIDMVMAHYLCILFIIYFLHAFFSFCIC